MKKILKFLWIGLVSSFSASTLVACDAFYNPPSQDDQALLDKVVNAINNNSDESITNYVKDDTQLKRYKSEIISKINTMLVEVVGDNSRSVRITITTPDETSVTENMTLAIKCEIADLQENCQFKLNFVSLKDYFDKILNPVISGQNPIMFPQGDSDYKNLLDNLVADGANFTGEKNNFTTAGKGAAFWKDYTNPHSETNTIIISPLCDCLDYQDSDLNFSDFTPKQAEKTIFVTGTKTFNNQSYKYIQLNMNIKYKTVDKEYQGLYMCFQ